MADRPVPVGSSPARVHFLRAGLSDCSIWGALVWVGLVFTLGVALHGCGQRDTPPNIVFVVLDTVRDDHTGVGGGSQQLTPNLDLLASQSTVFRNAWANSPWTVPSHASFFTGLLSSGHGCTHQHPRLDTTWPTLAELLGGAGYQTAAFYSNPWLSDRTTGLLRGFALKREAPLAGGLPNDPGRYRGDQGGRASVFNVQDWLQQRERRAPFFIFVNFLEAHLPYDPPPDLRQRFSNPRPQEDLVSGAWGMEYQAGLHAFADVDWPRVGELYAGDVMSADRLLGGLLRILENEDLVDQTVLIVTSDHGENLGDHGLVDHQFSVHETLLAAPLVIRAPGRLAPGERNDPVMLTDLFATVVQLAGLQGVRIPTASRSLLGEAAPAYRPLIAEYARPQEHLLHSLQNLNPECDLESLARSFQTVRVGRLRLTLASDGSQQLHDLQADPGQERNLSEAYPAEVSTLKSLLERLIPASGVPPGDEIQLDDQTREQLRSLGYVH